MEKIEIDVGNIAALIRTMKGIMPGNYESMDRIVAVVNYLEALLATKKEGENADNNNAVS